MTSENDFQRMLDRNPQDHFTRLVFADWLEERGDIRAEGYRALGVLRKDCTQNNHEFESDECPYWCYGRDGSVYDLPEDWFDLLEVRGKVAWDAPRWSERYDATRQELDDAAAIAFAKLPANRRVQLLNLQPASVA